MTSRSRQPARPLDQRGRRQGLIIQHRPVLGGPLDESRTHTPYWNPGLSRARLPVPPQGVVPPQHSPSLACKELRGLFSYVFSIPLVWCLCFVIWINQHVDAILFLDQGTKHVIKGVRVFLVVHSSSPSNSCLQYSNTRPQLEL